MSRLWLIAMLGRVFFTSFVLLYYEFILCRRRYISLFSHMTYPIVRVLGNSYALNVIAYKAENKL